MSKVRSSAFEAVADVVRDGMTIAVGGFGLCGIPFDLVDAVGRARVTGLVIVSNNMCVDGAGLGVLLEQRQVRKVIASYVGENHGFARQYLDGLIEVEFSPQGSTASYARTRGPNRSRSAQSGRSLITRTRGYDMWTREQMAVIAADELRDGDYVNLGIGDFPLAGQEDADLINAGKQTVTIRAGGSDYLRGATAAPFRVRLTVPSESRSQP
jgi:hypothetical protein